MFASEIRAQRNAIMFHMEKLDLNWNVTLQFNSQVSEEKAHKLAVCWTRRLEKKIFGRRRLKYTEKNAKCIGYWFKENFDKEGPHLHGQLRVPERYITRRADGVWLRKQGIIIWSKLCPAGSFEVGDHTPHIWRGYITKGVEQEGSKFFGRYFVVN